MTEEELRARIAPLGKRSQYELVRALYVWISYGVKVEFSRCFGERGKREFHVLTTKLVPVYRERDPKEVKRLMKNAKCSVNLSELVETCRKLSVLVETCSSGNKEKAEKEKALPPTPSIVLKEKDEEKKSEDLHQQLSGGEPKADDDAAFPSLSKSFSEPAGRVVDKRVAEIKDYWNRQDPRLFQRFEIIIGKEREVLMQLLNEYGTGLVKQAIDIAAHAQYLWDMAEHKILISTTFFFDTSNFQKIVNHRYDNRIRKLDKYQQAVEDNRRNWKNDFERTMKKINESHEGLLEEL